VGPDRFVEVHVTAAAEVCRGRAADLYARAAAGEIAQIPGADVRYEAPVTPALTLETDRLTPGEAVERLLALLRSRGIVAPLPL
jgi:adenylylsulfate kinase